MTRNKQQALRLSRAARTSIALALSLSMVLGLVPNGALRALAEEAETQDMTVVEDAEAGSGAAELQEDAAATEGASADEGTGEIEAAPEEDAAEVQGEAETEVAEGEGAEDEAAEGEDAAEAVEATEPQDTTLEAEADGMQVELVVKAGTELPEGSRLVVTSLAGAVEQAAAKAEAEEAAAAEVEAQQGQGSSIAALAGAVAGLGAETAEEQAVTGADVALTGMSDAVDTCVAEQLAEEEGEAEEAEGAEDAAPETQVTAAYAIEVVDGEDNLVPLSEDNAMMTVTLSKEVADEADGVYAVTRSEAEPEDEPQVTEAKGTPVATVAEEEYKDEKAAAEAVVYAGEAEDVTSNVEVDEETGKAKVVIVGAPSVIVTKNKPKKAPVGQPSTQDTNRVSLKNDGFTLNLFNYYAIENVNYNGGADNQVNHVRPEGINSVDGTNATLHPFQFYNGGTDGYNGFNRFVGSGIAGPMQGIMQNELDDDYYPVLAYPDENGTSLAYLFDETPIDQRVNGRTIHAKEVYANVDKLFERDEHGYYSYDSNKNYAYYDTSQGSGGDFCVHNDTYARQGQSVYKIGFFPFDQWTAGSNDSVSPGQKDHHLGLTMSGTFTLPETTDGRAEYVNPNTEQLERNPVLFEMGGDDDMLVFIDGVLVLDLGGIHQPVHGAINFTDGTVDIYGDPLNDRWPGTANSTIKHAEDTVGAKTPEFSLVTKNVNDNGTDYGDRPVYTASLDSIFGLVNKEWNGAPGSAHRIDVFYLERGSYDSNLLVRFNLPLTPTTDLNVKKEWYKQNTKETEHHDSIMVQLYQQVKTEDGYTEPRPYGDPVELKASDDFEYTFTGLPVHSHLETDYYYYTVKEGVVINGQFLPADDGQTISDGYVYGLDSITYEYDGDSTGARTEVYPDQKDAAFHNGNSTPVVGTATIKNKREGKITVQKQWLNSAGEPDQADHSGDEVAVQLVKLTKAATDDSFDNATEEVIEVTMLNAANNWRSGFESDQIVTGDPNVEYVVYEGYMNGSTFVRSNVLTTSSGAYELDSTRYMCTTISESSGDLQVNVDQNSPEHVAQNTRPLYWWIDEYQNRYWLNRTYGVSATELAVNNGSEPELLQDTVTQQLMIPYSAMLIPDDSGSTYDFVVDVSFAESQGVNLTSLAVGSGLSGSSYTITHDGSGYHLRVPAAWAKEHAGEAFTLNIGVAGNRTLQKVANADNRARLRVVPTSYVVTGMAGHSAPVQDMWESEDGLQLVAGGTGHAVITNKPHVATDVTIKKIDAKDSHVLQGAKFVVYENTGEDSYDAVDDTRPAKRFPDAETTFVSGSDGTVVIEDLTPGIYWIIETEAPAGYLVMGTDNPIGVKVAADGTVSPVDTNGAAITNPASTEPSIATADGVITLTVPNARAYELPAAGGPGAYPFLLVGSFIAALAFDRSGELRRKLARLLRQGARA